jgi:hypothetical protein
MFFNSELYWFLMGIIFVVIAAAFKAYADDRNWVITWWKGLIGLGLYILFAVSFYGWGTFIGENEPGAGFKFFLLCFFITLIVGVGFWRLLSAGSKKA